MTPLKARAVGAYARLVSGLFVVLGVVGLLKTQFHGFASNEGASLLHMTVNPLMNLIHLAAGLIGIWIIRDLGRARRYCLCVGAVALILGLLEFVVRDSSADILGRDATLGGAHAILGAVGLAVALWSRPKGIERPADAAPRSI
jgi:peptidoglycan/LPS O-acetylase OafA/YrhL